MNSEELKKMMSDYGDCLIFGFGLQTTEKFAFACSSIIQFCTMKGKIQKSEQVQSVKYMLDRYNMGLNPQMTNEDLLEFAKVIVNDKSIPLDLDFARQVEASILVKGGMKDGKVELSNEAIEELVKGYFVKK